MSYFISKVSTKMAYDFVVHDMVVEEFGFVVALNFFSLHFVELLLNEISLWFWKMKNKYKSYHVLNLINGEEILVLYCNFN